MYRYIYKERERDGERHRQRHNPPPLSPTPPPKKTHTPPQISQWHKKVVLVLNQIDLRPTPEEIAEVEAYVRDNARCVNGGGGWMVFLSFPLAVGTEERVGD